jgi:hypothetical protein
MKNITFLFVYLFLLVSPLTGQERTTITVKAGTRVIDYFPFNERYRYPEFIQGKVMFKNGNYTVTKFNYSILYGEMHFIQGKDTLSVANVKDIRYVQIMQDTFYYDDGFHEALAGYDPAIMTVKQWVKLSDKTKEGAYGTRTSTGSVQSYSGIYDQGGRSNYHLVLQEDYIFTRITDYYIGNTRDGFVLYKKNNLLKLFPDYKREIENYLKSNQINFKSREDLKKLTVYLETFRK